MVRGRILLKNHPFGGHALVFIDVGYKILFIRDNTSKGEVDARTGVLANGSSGACKDMVRLPLVLSGRFAQQHKKKTLLTQQPPCSSKLSDAGQPSAAGIDAEAV